MAFLINDPMPKDCTECSYRCGCNILARKGNYAEGCPLVEVPPHGELKDYDKIKEVLTKNFDVHADSLVYYILSLIDETDTVLEAST